MVLQQPAALPTIETYGNNLGGKSHELPRQSESGVLNDSGAYCLVIL